jgi:hypothetical protein
MPSETFTFPHTLNISLQIGDVAYYAATSTTTGTGGGEDFDTAEQNDIIRIGAVTNIDQANNIITCSTEDTFSMPATLPYIFFGKDNRVNTGSIVGYYAKVRFVNTSNVKGALKGEMFAASCDIFESSK